MVVSQFESKEDRQSLFADPRKRCHWPRCPMFLSSTLSGKSSSGAGATYKIFARKCAFCPGHMLFRIVFFCPFAQDLIINVVHESGELARWPDYKSRLPHLRRANRRLRSSASRRWRRRPINYQSERRRRREESLGPYYRQVRCED